MPKDAKKNVDRYKIRGGDLNEFEFHQNQAQVKESAEPRKGVEAKKAAKPVRSATTPVRGATTPVRGATAKKLAAKKAARKS